MNLKFQPLLIVANSARMLAQAAAREGISTYAIDNYGDHDTRFFVDDIQIVESLSYPHLQQKLQTIPTTCPANSCLYGSGFENYPESLDLLFDRFTVFGNKPEVFFRLHNKPEFFALLNQLNIPFPEVEFNSPTRVDNWLQKPMKSHGGLGIKTYNSAIVQQTDSYWQKYQCGQPHSALFLANGKESQIVGFNRQWSVALGAEPFLFSGVKNFTQLTFETKARIKRWLNQLVPKLGLVGLNSLDFIQSGDSTFVLEINPRPSASMQLYDAGLLLRHIYACQGELMANLTMQRTYAAYQVVYAKQDTVIPELFAWSKTMQDLPPSNSIINAGQPICSMIVHGRRPNRLYAHLAQQQTQLLNDLNRFQAHGK